MGNSSWYVDKVSTRLVRTFVPESHTKWIIKKIIKFVKKLHKSETHLNKNCTKWNILDFKSALEGFALNEVLLYVPCCLKSCFNSSLFSSHPMNI